MALLFKMRCEAVLVDRAIFASRRGLRVAIPLRDLGSASVEPGRDYEVPILSAFRPALPFLAWLLVIVLFVNLRACFAH